jgi:predicted RNA-binding Zn ribbon-like protein
VTGGQWIDSPDGRRWWFDAGATALDFVYTTRFRTDFGSFRASASVQEWMLARFESINSQFGERELSDANALREAIASLARAIVGDGPIDAHDVDTVNLYAATPDIPPVLSGSTRQAGRSSLRPAQALSSIAREAISLFGPLGRDRVRVCEADDCQLIFYDDSRAGSRRWCSMQRCGNRAKVRAFRARVGTPAPPDQFASDQENQGHYPPPRSTPK